MRTWDDHDTSAGNRGLIRPLAILMAAVLLFPWVRADASEPGAIGDLYVASFLNSKIVQFDGQTGALVGDFVASGSGGLDGPWGLAWGPNGNLFVVSRGVYSSIFGIAEYNGTTGALVRWVVGPADSTTVETGWLEKPHSLAFGPDGNIYVTASINEAVHEYDGFTGDYLGVFAIGGFSPGGLRFPQDMTFGPNGNLFLISSYEAGNPTGEGSGIFEYHHATGRLVRVLANDFDASVTEGAEGAGLCFRPNGNLLVTFTHRDLITNDTFTSKIMEYDGSTGQRLGAFVPDGSGLDWGSGMTYGPNSNLFVASIKTNSILEYDGQTGATIGTFASGGGISWAVDLAFKPAPPDPMPAPTISAVSVTDVDACDPLTGVVVTGTDLEPEETTVVLRRAGEPDYVGVVNGGSGDGTSLTVDFDLDGGARIAGGQWDVVVTNPDGQSATLAGAVDVLACPDATAGNLIAAAFRHRASHTVSGIIEYDGETGDIINWLTEDQSESAAGELWLAPGLTFGPNGNLFVATGNAGSSAGNRGEAVLQYDGVSGRFVGVFVAAGSGGLLLPMGLVFGPNGNLFVVDQPPGGGLSAVFEYDGFTGDLVQVFVSRGSCGLTNGSHLTFGPNGNLLVTGEPNGLIEFDGQTGACIGILGETDQPAGDLTVNLRFSPHNGNLLVAKENGERIVEHDGSTGMVIGGFDGYVSSGSGGLDFGFPSQWGMDFGPNGNLFVVSANGARILEFDGLSGAFVQSFSQLENPSGVAQNTDMAFAPLSGDVNGDWDRDLGDFAAFQCCYGGAAVTPNNTNCLRFDYDRDGDVDLDDFAAFAQRMTGAS